MNIWEDFRNEKKGTLVGENPTLPTFKSEYEAVAGRAGLRTARPSFIISIKEYADE